MTLGGGDRQQHLAWVWGTAITSSVLMGGISGCGNSPEIAPKPTTSIETLQAQAPSPAGKTTAVYVKGKVGDRAPLLNGTVYELTDATGSIWVLTRAEVPKVGQEVVVKGVVRSQAITLNGQEQQTTYLEQQ